MHTLTNQKSKTVEVQLASDWIKSVRKNVNKQKVVTILGSLLYILKQGIFKSQIKIKINFKLKFVVGTKCVS